MASSDRFGYEWNKYDYILPHYEDQFLRWVQPLTKESFKGKTVLDAGCGMGRNSYWALKYGASKLVAFDYDTRSVEAAKRTLHEFSNAEVVYADINTFQSEERFDLIFSIGVIHHLYRPDIALRNLASLLSPGGRLLIWVYGREGNERFLRLIDPLRIYVTSRLPVGIVHTIAYLFSVPLFFYTHVLPQRKPYLQLMKKFGFRHIHSIVFDQLIPKVANYWTREEAYQLLASIDALHEVEIHPVNGMSWTVTALKRGVSAL